MDVTEKVYKITSDFPSGEKFGLTNQIRRSAVSIASNIAEGAGRNSDKEFRNFLGIANGSLNELYTQLILSPKLKLVSEENINPILNDLMEIQKMNYTLIKKYS
ncbi:MAG: four helix bundle protein [Christiangramia sp.]|tara:strand:- start:697 stop:1008 length:312 start_codon:yes stop_codon:yes gene_type:complete